MKIKPNPFKVLEDKLDEGKKKWDKIKEETSILEKSLNDNTIDNKQIAKLIVLLVNHLNPLYSCSNKEKSDMQEVLNMAQKIFK